MNLQLLWYSRFDERTNGIVEVIMLVDGNDNLGRGDEESLL
jgi:hypothetical protein